MQQSPLEHKSMTIDSAKINKIRLNISSRTLFGFNISANAPMVTALLSSILLCACQSAPTTTKVITHPQTPTQQSTSTTVYIPTQSDTVHTESTNAEPIQTQSNESRQAASTQQTETTVIEDWTDDQSDQSPVVIPPADETSTENTTTPVPAIPPSASEPDSAVVIIIPPKPDPEETRRILLQRARQNSQANNASSTPLLNNGDNLPAFRQLMDNGISQLKTNQLSAAENSFTRAQRLAPQSSAVYFYLGQVALKKNQPRKAEAVARRGLTVAQSAQRRQALWQVILLAGQKQNNPNVVQEAQNALR
ncbi:tetratricopeptide repeat protein [Psychrobacter sp. I-STPA10]|uniref:tetratricopeptide repeat protein n=1 Tax=Psychrobacter sp. I-STPA10 TaxID=2585769 RepID=UPI001E3928C6|nr:tetratricopeptide repeat protein [Psychrobacter sp. I-STPA10]